MALTADIIYNTGSIIQKKPHGAAESKGKL